MIENIEVLFPGEEPITKTKWVDVEKTIEFHSEYALPDIRIDDVPLALVSYVRTYDTMTENANGKSEAYMTGYLPEDGYKLRHFKYDYHTGILQEEVPC
jgi:hypothetical protein